jgi:hypothetical protein
MDQQVDDPGAVYWNALITRGVVAVPMIESEALRKRFETEITTSVQRSPELKPDLSPQERLVTTLGGFGALGTASSFHFSIVRKLRGFILTKLVDRVFRYMPKRYNLEPVPDRLCVRLPGQKPSKEGGHRDFSPETMESDIVTGGWLNLSATSQYFSCLPGSQYEPVNRENRGFLTEDLVGRLKTQSPIECPSGHFIIFNQLIGHEVLSKPANGTFDIQMTGHAIQSISILKPYIKLFMGFRMTSGTASMMGAIQQKAAAAKLKRNTKKTMYRMTARGYEGTTYKNYPEVVSTLRELYQKQALPLLPSGQDIPLYSSNHSSSFMVKPFGVISDTPHSELFRLENGLETFSKRFIETIPRQQMHSKERDDPVYVVPRYLPSLEELNLKMEDYTEEELEIVSGVPKRAWRGVATLEAGNKWVVKPLRI